MSENAEGVILLLLRQQSLSHAVRLYQDEMQVPHFEARTAVLRLARENDIRLRSAWVQTIGSLLLIAAAGLLGTALLIVPGKTVVTVHAITGRMVTPCVPYNVSLPFR